MKYKKYIKYVVLLGSISSLFFIWKKIQFTADLPVSWLGDWRIVPASSTDSIRYESWKQSTPDSFSGRGWLEKDGKTVELESLQLTYRNGVLHYIPTVKGHNNEQPIPFALVRQTPHSWVFENLEHDFPQQISYQITVGKQMLVRISGIVDGSYRYMDFNFAKV